MFSLEIQREKNWTYVYDMREFYTKALKSILVRRHAVVMGFS